MTQVGFVGVGAMGSVMAGHVIAAGHDVIGWDQNPAAVEGLVAAGGRAATGLNEVCAAPVVISMLSGGEPTRDVTLRGGGLVELMRADAVHVVTATIMPVLSRELSEAHAAGNQHYLAASVFGRPEAAVAGALLVNGSGARAAFDRVEPVLACFGETRWVGPEPEQAMLVKLIGNSMIYAAVEGMREAFRLLRAGGIDEAAAKAAVIDSLLPGPIYAGYSRDYAADPASIDAIPIGGSVNTLTLETARALGVDLPLMRFMQDHVFVEGHP